jgi:hypothetical protein
MRRRFLALLIMGGAAALLPQGTRAQGWMEYKPEGGRFKVELPALPRIAIVQVPIGNGNTVPMTEATSMVSRVAYIASYVDYPSAVTKGAAADVILTKVRDGAAAGGSYREERKLQLGRVEGREYTVVQGNGNVAVTRTYWSRGRLFTLVVDGRAGIETQSATRQFLDSFALVQ